MKFDVGQEVSLLTIDGQPAVGKSIINAVNTFNHTYTVDFYRANSERETISNIPEGRLLALPSVSEKLNT